MTLHSGLYDRTPGCCGVRWLRWRRVFGPVDPVVAFRMRVCRGLLGEHFVGLGVELFVRGFDAPFAELVVRVK